MNFYIQPDLKKYFTAEPPLFDQLMALGGEVFRAQKGRVTQRVLLGGKPYFIKQHHGVGWLEIIKNVVLGRKPVIGASNEWLAIQKLNELGVRAPTVVAYGERGWNPAAKQSFILMEELTPIISLEDLCQHWRTTPPRAKLKFELIRKVATIARLLHQHGMNHRDFYICHFLMRQNESENPELYLIDLHRAQIRMNTPTRWVIKDLAGLYFSSKEIGLTKRDYFRFMKTYRELPLRNILATENSFWHKVMMRGDKLFRDHNQ